MFWGKQDLSPRVKATQRSLVQKSRYYSGLVCDLMKGRGSPLGNIVVSLCEDCKMGECCEGFSTWSSWKVLFGRRMYQEEWREFDLNSHFFPQGKSFGRAA